LTIDEQAVEICQRTLETQVRTIEVKVRDENVQSVSLDIDVARTVRKPFPRKMALEYAW
jgi:hypothetical protein